MYKSIRYNRLFWIIHTLGWILFISFDFYNDIDVYRKVPMLYYWIVSNVALYFILPVLRSIYKRLISKSGLNLVFILKILVLIFFVGFFRKMIDYLVYIFLSFNDDSLIQLLKNIYYSQIVNFFFIKRSIALSIPIIMWTVLYFGIKTWFDLTSEKEKSERAFLLAQEAQLKMLRYQLNPHFLFNSLNSIQALIYENQKLADNVLTELSEFLRYTLKNTGKLFVPLKEEVEAIEKYLNLEKIRFEEKLDFEIDLSKESEEVEILSFLLQPLIENSIKHGIKTSQIPLRISIKAKTISDKLSIIISNTGNWINKNSEGTGLNNIKSRLSNYYTDNYKLDVRNENNHVIVELSIPI